MKSIFRFAASVVALASIFACNKISEPQMNEESASLPPITKAIGDKTPVMAVYVETNDVNPLNAGDYYFTDNGKKFIDIVELFAANIHKETVNGQVRPTLYLNDKLTNVLENETVEDHSSWAKNGGYGAMMDFNLRTRNNRDALPVFQALSDGAYGGRTVSCSNGNRTRDAVIAPNGFTITYDTALTWLAE